MDRPDKRGASVVSTHSRAEAAAEVKTASGANLVFQHTAARRRLLNARGEPLAIEPVSTHSRAEAAALGRDFALHELAVSTHSRAEAAARPCSSSWGSSASFNTQPRGGGCQKPLRPSHLTKPFQHTAARRRLPIIKNKSKKSESVSTHSRAEAAA